VVRLRGATRVPGAPAWVVGLLNVRGAVIAAGDLALLAGAAAAAGPVVLVEADGRRAGLRVDAVIGVQSAELTGSEAPPAAVGRGGGLPSAGLARLTSEGVAHAAPAPVELPLLDVRAVLDDILEGDASL
jgi:chemotaxis signal transduction protein